MTASIEGRLISRIYDVAVDEACLGDALVELASATGCQTASLEVYTPVTGRFLQGRNPLISDEHANAYLEYWRHNLPCRRSSAPVPVGKIMSSNDLWDRELVVKSAFFNDWLRPQGMGGDGRYANVSKRDGTIVVLGAFKPFKAPTFDPDQQHLFRTAAHHFSRAIKINSKLKTDALIQAGLDEYEPAVAYLVVDQKGRAMAAHERAHRQLVEWGLLSSAGGVDTISESNPHLTDLIRKVATGEPGNRDVELRTVAGVVLRISAIPVRPDKAVAAPWLNVPNPAALLRIVSPKDVIAARIRTTGAQFSLTKAEQLVVAEIVKGHGRKAVAERLNLKETTVRTHLSSIFAKMGIERQAELCRVVLDA